MYLAVTITSWLFYLAGVVVAVLAVWALVDCLTRPADRFSAAGRLSKGAWIGMTAGATAVMAIGLLAGGGSSIFTLAAAVIAGVYLGGIRPVVSGKGTSWY